MKPLSILSVIGLFVCCFGLERAGGGTQGGTPAPRVQRGRRGGAQRLFEFPVVFQTWI